MKQKLKKEIEELIWNKLEREDVVELIEGQIGGAMIMTHYTEGFYHTFSYAELLQAILNHFDVYVDVLNVSSERKVTLKKKTKCK